MSASVAVRPSLFGRLYDWLQGLLTPNLAVRASVASGSMLRRETTALSAEKRFERTSAAALAEIQIIRPALDEAAARALEVIVVAPAAAADLAKPRVRQAAAVPSLAARLGAVHRLNAGLSKAPARTVSMAYATTAKCQHHRPAACKIVKAPCPAAAKRRLQANRPVVYARAA